MADVDHAAAARPPAEAVPADIASAQALGVNERLRHSATYTTSWDRIAGSTSMIELGSTRF